MIKDKLVFKWFPLIVLLLTCCKSGEKDGERENDTDMPGINVFDTRNLALAWEERDTAYIKKYISFLENPYLSDVEFYELVSELSDKTEFCFGNIDIEDPRWKNLSTKQQQRKKQNTAQVFKLYMKSCMFMKVTTWDETLEVQDWYKNFYDNDTVYVKNNPQPILDRINTLCRMKSTKLHEDSED